MPRAKRIEGSRRVCKHQYADGTYGLDYTDTWRVWVEQAYAVTSGATCTIATMGTGSNVTAYAHGAGSIIWHGDSTTNGAGAHIWRNWVEYADTIGVEAARNHRVVSEEERARWRERERQLEAQAAEANAKHKAAELRAEELLVSILTPQQRVDLKMKNRFFLHIGEKRYRVDRGQHGNVKLVDAQDKVVESYCIQPRGGLPDADAMAAQVLMLETDEASFLRVANVSGPNGYLIRRGAQA